MNQTSQLLNLLLIIEPKPLSYDHLSDNSKVLTFQEARCCRVAWKMFFVLPELNEQHDGCFKGL